MCGLEFPDLEASIWQPLRDQGVQVIGIDTGGLFGSDTASRIQQFIDQTGVTFPIGWDASRSYTAFPGGQGISPFPLDVVIDRQGNIAYVSREYDAEAMLNVVRDLL